MVEEWPDQDLQSSRCWLRLYPFPTTDPMKRPLRIMLRSHSADEELIKQVDDWRKRFGLTRTSAIRVLIRLGLEVRHVHPSNGNGK